MTHIIPKVAYLEYAIHPDAFCEEWKILGSDVEPTQKDYDEWLIDCTHDWIYNTIGTPRIKLMENN